MKNLAFSRRFIFTLFAVLFGVNLWGQDPEPINLANCTITINGGNPYLCTSTNVTVNSSEVSVWYKDEYDVIHYVTSGFTIRIGGVVLDGEHPATKGIGKYTLTVTGDGITCSNSKDRDFYVLPGNSTYYTISSKADWNLFAECVNDGYSFDGLTVKLVADITNENPITTMVGSEDNSKYFSGIFDGEYFDEEVALRHILYFTRNDEYGCAPFCTTGATIKNLIVEGRITSTGGYSAGLIYYNHYDDEDENQDSTYVRNVTVDVNINADGQYYCGGFAVDGDGVQFSKCDYTGTIVAGDSSSGFCATGKSKYTKCIFNPDDNSEITIYYGGENFGSVDDEINDIINCYYTMQVGSSGQGTLAYKTAQENIITKNVTVNNTDVYKPVTVAVNNNIYNYTGLNITITPSVMFDGNTVYSDNQYTYTISPETVKDAGEYTLTIYGKIENGYYGSYTNKFYVVEPLSGSGTSEDPYIIASEANWLTFANNVNTYGCSYSGQYLKLTANISVSTMVGTSEHPFKGHFSGATGVDNGIYTLTFNYGTSGSPTEEEIVAPFRYTDGATITYLKVNGDIYTNVGKEAGLIGVNTKTSANTQVTRVIVEVGLHCGEDLWDAEGGGFAYIGNGITFNSCAYRGYISANNYMGGFCGNADASTTVFTYCLFNPNENGVYWAENFVYNMTGSIDDKYYKWCYFTLGHNQEESEQGILVYVGSVPGEAIGKKLTELYSVVIYTPILVTISNVNDIYIYDENVTYTITPTVKFNGTTVTNNTEYTYTISPTTVHAIGSYTLTITGKTVDESNIYEGSITKSFEVVNGSSPGWAELQALLSGDDSEIKLTKDYSAGVNDAALSIPASRTVRIYLNGHTIDRHLTDASYTAGGQVLRISANANVTIIGRGYITGGRNKASNNNEHGAYNDGGAIYNMGNLTLIGYYDNNYPDPNPANADYVYDTIFISGNKCVKYNYPNAPGTYRTARGGAIYSGIGSTLTIHGCVIRDNNAQGGGGGVFADKAVLTIDHNTVIRSNTSLDKGGGIRVDANGVVAANITDCKISSNTVVFNSDLSVSNGGGVHFDGGTLNLTKCIINNNNSSKYGGGIYQMGGTLNATNCTISYNQSYDENNRFEGYGGGVCVLGGTFVMDGGTITGNSSYIESGGGVFVAAGKTFKIEGAVNIYGNWTYENSSLTEQHITNVYLVGANDKITINGNIEGASVGVSKKGGTGQFTSNLQGKGTIANFSSDNTNYQILPIKVGSKQEAQIGTPAEMPSTIDDENLPTGITIVDADYVISIPYVVDKPVTITKNVRFVDSGCFIITKDGILRVPSITNSDPLKIIIDDGGQIIFTGTPGDVAARVKKEVEEFSNYSGYWYLISSPVNNPAIATATNIVTLNPVMVEPTPGYDLYRFNEAATAYDAEGDLLHWENYRNEAYHGESPTYPFDNMTNGRGYLYRSCQDYTLTIDGDLNVGDVTSYTLTNSNTPNIILKGFNIIGNPYPHNIKKGAGQAIPNTYLEDKYYVLNPEGCVWTLKTDATEIPPFTGILVQANSEVTASGQTLTISDVTVSSSKGDSYEKSSGGNIWFTVANNVYEDKACVEFREGHGLNKIAHINEDAPMLYIHHNDEDFASVDMATDTRAFNLNFEAKKTGTYTLKIDANGDYKYLHLIDKLAGEDIDLLLENEYTFVGSKTDNADRFIVRLSNGSHNNDIFAYQNGSDIIVSGEGTLQIFDVMGRLVAQKYVNGVETMCTSPLHTGVYILRLNEMTQKIIIK